MRTYTYIHLLETSEQPRKCKGERRLLVGSSIKQDKSRLAGNIQRLLSAQEERYTSAQRTGKMFRLSAWYLLWRLTIICQAIWSKPCPKMLLKYIDPCCQLMKLLYKPALFRSFELSNRFWYSQGSGWQGKVTWCFLTPSNKSSAPPLKWKQRSTEILLYCQKEDRTKEAIYIDATTEKTNDTDYI